MTVEQTNLEGCFVFTPNSFEDSRGYFFESFNKRNFEKALGKKINFVQSNQSKSNYGVLRGLHFQKNEFAQAKLVRVLSGEVLDVAVDLRKDSDSYGNYFSVLLTEKNKKQLFIPRGFAHGFIVLSESAEFHYQCDNYYTPSADAGIIYNDSNLNIDWKLEEHEIILSDKDKALPTLQEL